MKSKKKKKQKSEYDGLTYAQAFVKAMKEVEAGSPFRCDLSKHSLTVGGERIVDNGRFVGSGESGFDLVDDLVGTDDSAVLGEIEKFYPAYKRSVPSERSERKERLVTQFRALPIEELSDDDMLYGERREEAQAKLEMFVLFAIVSGRLRWRDEWGTWYWRSGKDRDLVLLKQWFNDDNDK